MSNRRYDGTRTSFKDVDPLTSPHYEGLWRVSRCLHIGDVEDSQRQGMLVFQPIRNSRTLGHNTRVLWFAPTQSMDKHNFYGNVSYVISWQTVLNKMGPHLYLIDQAIYGDHAYTRILLTKKNYDVLLQKVDLHSEGSTIIKRSNKYLHASKCYCKNGSGVHELQIGIEATEEDARWLYSHCTVMANNHSRANALMHRQITRKDGKIKKYAPFKCFLYNTTLNRQCPNPDSLGQTEATLSFMNIPFSSSLPPKKEVDSDKENINHNKLSYPQNGIGARTPSVSMFQTDVSSHTFGARTPSVSKPQTDVSSHAFGARTPSASKPQTDVSSHAFGARISSASKPQTDVPSHVFGARTPSASKPQTDVSPPAFGARTPSTSKPRTDVSSHAFGARNLSARKPLTDVSSHTFGARTPSASKPQTDVPTHASGARTPGASRSQADVSSCALDAQTSSIKPQIRDGQSQPVAIVPPSVRQPRKKLRPIARKAGAPTALSGQHEQRTGQHHSAILPGTGSACNWQPPQQTPFLPKPTIAHSLDPSDMMISHPSSSGSSSSIPVESNDWRPIAREDNCDRPEGSFTERLRRWFMCCC